MAGGDLRAGAVIQCTRVYAWWTPSRAQPPVIASIDVIAGRVSVVLPLPSRTQLLLTDLCSYPDSPALLPLSVLDDRRSLRSSPPPPLQR